MPIFMHIHSHCKPSLIIASTSALEEEQLSFHTSNYTEENANMSACRHTQKRSIQPQTAAIKCTTATTCPDAGSTALCGVTQPAGCAATATVVEKVICQRVNQAVAFWHPQEVCRETRGVSEGHFPFSPVL